MSRFIHWCTLSRMTGSISNSIWKLLRSCWCWMWWFSVFIERFFPEKHIIYYEATSYCYSSVHYPIFPKCHICTDLNTSIFLFGVTLIVPHTGNRKVYLKRVLHASQVIKILDCAYFLCFSCDQKLYRLIFGSVNRSSKTFLSPGGWNLAWR